MKHPILNRYLHLKSLFINISSLSVIQLMNILFPAITLPYLVRVLGPEKYGLVNFAIIFSTYFLTLSEYGFNLSATREVSVNRDDRELVNSIFSNVFFSKVLLGLISLILYLVILVSFNKFKSDISLYLISFGYVVGATLFPMWYFQGTEKMAFLPGLFFIPRSVGTVLIFVFVTKPGDYLELIIIYSAVQIVTGLAGFLFAIKKNDIQISKPSREGIKQQLTTSYKIFLSNVSINIYISSASILLGLLVGNTAVGIYVAADKIRNLISSFLSTISTGVYPYVNKLLQDSKEGFIRFNIKLMKLRGVLTLILSSLLFTFADLLVKVILGNLFVESARVLKILAFLPFITTFSNSLGIQIMLPLKKEKEFLRIVSIAALINLILAYPLIINLTVLGAAYSILITEMLVTLMMFIFLFNKTYFKERFNEV